MISMVLGYFLFSSIGFAHDFSEHWISVSLYKNTIRIKATPPTDHFLQFDADGDGVLSEEEEAT